MSRTRSVAAFLATVLVAVPAGWHALDASIESDGPAIRPEAERIIVDGATVTVELDRGLLAKGGTLKARLVATSDVPTEIALDVRALQNNGFGEERVQNPPTLISKKRVTVKAGPSGGEPVEVVFKLGTQKRKGTVQWYDIDVMKAGARFVAPTDERKPNDPVYDWGEGQDKTAARVGAAVWSGNSFPISITPVGTIPAEGAFDVAVTVKNTTKHDIIWMDVDLGSHVSGGGLDNGIDVNSIKYVDGIRDDPGYTAEEVDEPTPDEGSVPKGETKAFVFRVTPTNKLVKKFTFVAHAAGDGHGAVEMVSMERPPAADAPQPAIARK